MAGERSWRREGPSLGAEAGGRRRVAGRKSASEKRASTVSVRPFLPFSIHDSFHDSRTLTVFGCPASPLPVPYSIVSTVFSRGWRARLGARGGKQRPQRETSAAGREGESWTLLLRIWASPTRSRSIVPITISDRLPNAARFPSPAEAVRSPRTSSPRVPCISSTPVAT